MSNSKTKTKAICILGVHRSGTSAVVRAINLLGAYIGKEADLMPPQADNPKGYWERMDIYNLHKRILHQLSKTKDTADIWDTTLPLPEKWHLFKEIRPLRNELVELIKKDFLDYQLWAWKDPRTSILMPIWKDVLDELGLELSCVFVIRNPLDVAKSLEKRDGFPHDKSFGIWFNQNIAALQFTSYIPRVFISYDRLVDDWESELRRCAAGLRIDWPGDDTELKEKMNEFICPDMRHSISGMAGLKRSNAPHPVKKLYKLLQGIVEASSISDATFVARVEKLSKEFSSYARFFQYDIANLWEKEQRLVEKDNLLTEHGQQLAEKERETASDKDTIGNLETIITNRDNHIGNLEASLLEKNAQNEKLASVIEDKDMHIGYFETIIRDKEAFLNLIYNSHGWKVLSFYYKVRNKLFPLNSKRRYFTKTFFNTIIRPREALRDFKSKLKKLIYYPENVQPAVLEENMERNIFQNSSTDKQVTNNIAFTEDIYDGSFAPPKENDHILVIDLHIPAYDKDSGSLRMYSILGILIELGYKITFIPDNLQKIEPYVSKLQRMGIKVLYGNIDIERYLGEKASNFAFVILTKPEVAFKYISLIRAYAISSIIIYNPVDLHWLRFERASSITGKEEYLNKAKHYKSIELFNASYSDIVFTVTKVEKDILLKEVPALKIEVIPNIHVVNKLSKSLKKRSDIMFIGAFLHHPNEDAVFYFVREIFPIIKEKITDIRFFIVGSNPSDAILGLNSKDIIVTGYVKDVVPYFKNCRVFVSPLIYGAGMKGKIGQSMAYGLPVVTTTIGAEGIGLINGENALIADEPEAFADAVVRLYTDEILWNKISRKSIEVIQKNYSKEVVSKKIAEVLNSIKQQKPLDFAHS